MKLTNQDFISNSEYNLFFASNPYIGDCVESFTIDYTSKKITIKLKETKTLAVFQWLETLPTWSFCSNGPAEKTELDKEIKQDEPDVDYLNVPEPIVTVSEAITIIFNNSDIKEEKKTQNSILSLNDLILFDHTVQFDKQLDLSVYGIESCEDSTVVHTVTLIYKNFKILNQNIKI